MKILYIDNRLYGHNADLHIKFIQHMHNKKYHEIFGYGKYMNKYFRNNAKPFGNAKKDINRVLKKFKPDIILTYNCNGSSYEVGLDNINLYKWISNELSTLDIPKFHITTDYCRSGFRKEQAQWFSDLNYTAAIFRHKISTKYPLKIDKHWLPFSVDSALYLKNISKNIRRKEKKVSFLGAAHNSSKSLYANRIAAIDFLNNKGYLKISKIVDRKKFKRKMLFGENYVKFLNSTMFSLTCGGTCDFMTAKYFQIPAAYSMLVCTETSGLEIFPKDTYILFDKNNLDKMYEQIIFYSNHPDLTIEKIDTLHRYVIKNHNNDIRIREFNKIISKYL